MNIFINRMYIEIHRSPIEIVNNFLCESIGYQLSIELRINDDLTGSAVDLET